MSMFDGLGSGIGINREQPVLDEGGKAFAASTAGYSACRLVSRSHAESAESRDRGGAGRFRRQAAATLDAVLVASAFRRKLRACNTDERRMMQFSWLPPSGGSSYLQHELFAPERRSCCFYAATDSQFAASAGGWRACRLLSRSHAEGAESRDRG